MRRVVPKTEPESLSPQRKKRAIHKNERSPHAHTIFKYHSREKVSTQNLISWEKVLNSGSSHTQLCT